MCFWTVNIKNVFTFVLPLQVETECLMWGGDGWFSSLRSVGSDKIPAWPLSPEGRWFRTEFSGVFQYSFLPPPASRSPRGFFSFIYYNLVDLLEINLTKAWMPLWLGSFGVVNSQTVHGELPARLQFTLRVFQTSTNSWRGFCSSKT